MDNFNMKQWLQENKIGPYSKVSLNEMNPAAMGVGQEEADAEMQKKDDENGDWVDNASMDVVAEYYETKEGSKDIKQYQPNILGKDYQMDLKVDYEFHNEDADYLDGRMVSPKRVVVDNVKVVSIDSLAVDEGGDDYRDINDPAAINQIKDLLNTDRRLNTNLKDEVLYYISGVDEAGIVGYVMKTKEADPVKQF